MNGVNQAIILGTLGRDPESRTLQAGGAVVSFSVATSETWKDKGSEERKERTTWHRIVIFNEPLGDIAMKFLRKGSKVYLQGSIQHRKYTDKDGAERDITEIVLNKFDAKLSLVGDPLGGRDGASADREGASGGYQPRPAQQRPPEGGARPKAGARAAPASWELPDDDLNDDVPF